MSTGRFITGLEHQPLPVTGEGDANSLSEAEAERLAQIGEQRPGFCERAHRRVKLAQFCGVVGLGQRVLEVLPKTQGSRTEVEACRGVLLRLLRRAGHLPTVEHQSAGQHLRRVPLLETFIATFFQEVSALVRGGLLRQYQQHEEDLRLVRGRIDAPRQLGRHANRPDMVACVFDELTADNPWNRVLKKAIRVTRPWILSAPLHRRWVELMGVLDQVDDSCVIAGEIGRLTFDRRADRYRGAVQWARWILDLLAPTLRAGQSEAPALLFDMNKLFEQAVAKVVRQRAWNAGALHVEVQDTSQHFGAILAQAGWTLAVACGRTWSSGAMGWSS